MKRINGYLREEEFDGELNLLNTMLDEQNGVKNQKDQELSPEEIRKLVIEDDI